MAKELLRQNRVEEGVELLDLGLERLPTSQIRFTDANTYPFLEAYYAASALGAPDAAGKGDALLREYARTLIEYIEYYLQFEGAQGDMISGALDEKLDQLGDVYYLASYAGRRDVVAELNDYYRSLGVSEENLLDAGDKPHGDTVRPPGSDRRGETPGGQGRRPSRKKVAAKTATFFHYGLSAPPAAGRTVRTPDVPPHAPDSGPGRKQDGSGNPGPSCLSPPPSRARSTRTTTALRNRRDRPADLPPRRRPCRAYCRGNA